MHFSASGVSTLVTSMYFSDWAQPPPSAVQYSQENLTSSDVTGVPSDHFRPPFSFQVIWVKSALTPPFSTVGTVSTSHGTNAPSWL